MCGNSAQAHGYVDDVQRHLLGRSPVHVFDRVAPEPSQDTVMDAARFVAATRAKVVLAVGGGGVIDVAKAANGIAGTNQDVLPFMDRQAQFSRKQARLIALPTTAGTGSEVTPFAVITDSTAGVRKPMESPFLYPDAAIVVPRFAATVPQEVRAETGIDALCHAYEALWSINASEVSDAIAFRAVKLITENFASYYDDPTDATARNAMVCGATLAGKAFSNTFTAACEALSYPISALFGLSHGASCAITLPLIAELNSASVQRKFIDLAAYLRMDSPGAVVASIAALCRHAATIPRLGTLGASRADLALIAATVFQPLLVNNPVPLTEDGIVRLLERAIDNAA